MSYPFQSSSAVCWPMIRVESMSCPLSSPHTHPTPGTTPTFNSLGRQSDIARTQSRISASWRVSSKPILISPKLNNPSLPPKWELCTNSVSTLHVLSTFYGQRKIVRMKWESHILQRRFLDRWMNSSFGTPDRQAVEPVVIAVGAAGFSSTSKYQVPTPNKRILDMLSKRYCVILVDEFMTSQVCCVCGSHVEPMRRRFEEQDGQHFSREVRGVRQCTTGCLTTHDRDRNAAQNIMNILLHWLTHSKRPTPWIARRILHPDLSSLSLLFPSSFPKFPEPRQYSILYGTINPGQCLSIVYLTLRALLYIRTVLSSKI